METIVLEAVIRIRYSEPVNVPLMLVHYRKILHKGVVPRRSVLLSAVLNYAIPQTQYCDTNASCQVQWSYVLCFSGSSV